MNSQSNSSQANSTRSQKGKNNVNYEMNSQSEDDFFDDEDNNLNDKIDSKRDNNKAQNLNSNRISDSSPLFETDDETSIDNKDIKKNKDNQNIQKNQQNQNEVNKNEDSDYLDMTEEDEGELDVSEEIPNEGKNQTNKNIKDQTIKAENKNKINHNDNDDDFDLHGLTSSSSQGNSPSKNQSIQSLILIEEEEEEGNEQILKTMDEQPTVDNSSENSNSDNAQSKSYLNHLFKQEFAKVEIQTLLEASFSNNAIDIFFSYLQEEAEEHQVDIKTKDQKSESTSYTENAEEEEVKQKHRRRKHRRSKYEYDEKSANNPGFIDDDEMEIINNISNDEEIHPEENKEKTEKSADVIQKITEEEEEKVEKENIIEEEEEEEKEILPEKDKKEEEETKEKEILPEKDKNEEDENEKEILSTKDKNEEEETKEKEILPEIDKVEEEEETTENEILPEKDKNEGILPVEDQKEEEELKEKENSPIKDKNEEEEEQNEENKNNDEKEKIKDLFDEEEEEKKSQKEKILDLFNEEEDKISFNEEEEKKISKKKILNLFNEEEEKKSEVHKNNDLLTEEEEEIPKSDKNKSEEETNQTVSCIPSEQFASDLNISPIKKTDKSKKANLDNLTGLSSEETKKSSFKQKILQQFSNDDQDYSDTTDKQQRLISDSLINHPGSRIYDEVEKEQPKRRHRRRKIPINKLDDQIETQKVDNTNNQQKPRINRRGRKRSNNNNINTDEINNSLDFDNSKKSNNDNKLNDDNISAEQNNMIFTPIKTRKVVKRRAKSAQKPSKQSSTPTEIEISSLKVKKTKPRSESVKLKRTKKPKKVLSDMSTQTDKFQIDENQIFVFEKVKSTNMYHFITNNNYYDLEILNEKEPETQTETEIEPDNSNINLPIINKKKRRNISPSRRKRGSASKSKKKIVNDDDEKFNDSLILKRNQPPKRNLSEQPRKRKKMKPIEDTDDDDNIVIDFSDTMYECNQQYSPQSKIEVKKKEELYSRYRSKRKHKNDKSIPIHLITLTTNEASPESESSDAFHDESDDNINQPRTNHQWSMDEIKENKTSKNKTLKSKPKTKLKTKSRPKKRSKSASHISNNSGNENSLETQNINQSRNYDNKNSQEAEIIDQYNIQTLPEIKRPNIKRRRKQKNLEPKTYDGNEFEKEHDKEKFSYEDDFNNQKQYKKEKGKMDNSNHNFNKGNTIDLAKDIDSLEGSEKNKKRYYSNETIQRSPTKSQHQQLDQQIEITDSIAYETEEIMDSNLDYSDEINIIKDYEAPKELFDGLDMAFHCISWETALNGIFNINIFQTPNLEEEEDYYSEQ